MSQQEILDEFHLLEPDDIRAAIAYAAHRLSHSQAAE
jgi:uncharacterized protein (DUF433 family)